jgi:hypothetical protein
MNSYIEESSSKIEYVNFDNLEEFPNNVDFEVIWKECYSHLDDVQTTDWLGQYNSINILRRLNKFEQKVFEALLDKLIFSIAKLASSIRSNISKLALILCGEIFHTHNYNTKTLKQLVPAVLCQSAHLKQFIKDEAQTALVHLSKCKSNTFEIIQLLSEGVTNKNPTISETSLNHLLNFIRNCSLYDIQTDEWRSILVAVVNIYSLKKEIYTKKALKLLTLYIEILDDSFDSVVKHLAGNYQIVINNIRFELASKLTKGNKQTIKDYIKK